MADEKFTKVEEKQLDKPPQVTAVKAPEVAPSSVVMVATLYGDMVDPTTGERYTRTPKDLARPSGWVTSQIEAKKMAIQ